MSPSTETHTMHEMSFPRVSGDEPRPTTPALTFSEFSPRERG